MKRILVVTGLALFVLALAVVPAFAQAATEAPELVGNAIEGAADDGLGVITTNMPLVFGVAIAFVVWKVGKRVLGRI